jgi:RNA polymerase sigma-70 factor (ECF subfamily)
LLPNERTSQIEELFRQYGRGVGSYILARVGNADFAETITSNVFMIVVRRIDQCRSSPSAWLWSIVRSELARHFRQHRPTVELDEKLRDPALTPPELASQNEMQQRMRIAIDQLNEEQQRIVYLKFFQDVSNTEIAIELGLSASNVGVIVHRAIKRLRELMEEREGAFDDKALRVPSISGSPAESGGPPPEPVRNSARTVGKSALFLFLMFCSSWLCFK